MEILFFIFIGFVLAKMAQRFQPRGNNPQVNPDRSVTVSEPKSESNSVTATPDLSVEADPRPVVSSPEKTMLPPVANVQESDATIEVTSEFKEALSLIESGAPFVFVTGRAGTGKSTFISLLRSRIRNYVIVAPTGVAALNVGGQTIHSFFGFPPTPIDLSSIQKLPGEPRKYKVLKTLIIDEISMVRADFMEGIEKFLRLNGPKPGEPFGGVQIIAVGDLFQLPPIVVSHEERDYLIEQFGTPFFFGSHAVRSVEMKVIEFTEVFRQRDPDFVALLNSVRDGSAVHEAVIKLNERVMPPLDDGAPKLILCATNAIADEVNYREMSALPSALTTYRATIQGNFRIVDKDKLPAPYELHLKVGAQVMFVHNSAAPGCVNGTLGIVTELGPDYVLVQVAEAGRELVVRVSASKWEQFDFRYDALSSSIKSTAIGKYQQIPLVPAWAITIHKSQGKTFDKAHIDLGRGAFAAGQVYVALSRCRTLAGITLENDLAHGDLRVDYDVVQFFAGVRRLTDPVAETMGAPGV